MWMYLAGFIDCDGWITRGTSGRKGYLAGMCQHDSRIKGMIKIQSFLNQNKIRNTLIHRGTNMINIHIKHQESLLIFLKNIRDYLLFKQDKADRAIIWLNIRLKERKRNAKIRKLALKNQDKRRYWKDFEMIKLKNYLKDGYSISEIAMELNRSYMSVAHKINRNRIRLEVV